MKMLVALLGMLAMGSATSAQGVDAGSQRIQAIWSAADQRMTQQLDAWFDRGEFPACVQLLRMRYDLHPDDYEIATDLGWMLENLQKNEEAILVYEKFLRDNPNDSDAALPVATYYYMKRDYPKAVEILQGRVKDTSHPNSFRVLAHSYERSGKLKESEALWLRYLKLHPDDPAAKNNLTRVQAKLAGG